MASKEDEDTIKIGEDDENNFLSDQHLQQSNEVGTLQLTPYFIYSTLCPNQSSSLE